MSADKETTLQQAQPDAPPQNDPNQDAKQVDAAADDCCKVDRDCLAEYQSSFMPYFQLFKNPLREWPEGIIAVFKPRHENMDTHLKAFAFWCMIKIYVVLIREFVRFVVVGIVIGFIGPAITGMIMGLIFGFLLSHLFWFIVIYRKGCCGHFGYAIMGGLNVLGVILAFIMFIESATSLMWEFFPAIIPSDLLGLVNMVPSTYQAILLFMLFQKEQNGETRGEPSKISPQPAASQAMVVAPQTMGDVAVPPPTASTDESSLQDIENPPAVPGSVNS